MKTVEQHLNNSHHDSGNQISGRWWMSVLAIAVFALAASTAPVYARGSAGAGGGGAAGAGAGAGMGSHGSAGSAVGQPGGIGPTYRHQIQHQHRYRYGDGSAGLVRGRPDCGLGGPCQTGAPVERPNVDYGHRPQ